MILDVYNFENWPNENEFSIQFVRDEAYSKYKTKRSNAEAYILLCVVSGTIVINHNGLDYTATEGDTILLSKNTVQMYYSDNQEYLRFIQVAFCGETIEAVINKLIANIPVIYHNFYCYDSLKDIICFSKQEVSLKKKIAYSYGKINEILYLMYEMNLELPEKGDYTFAGQDTPQFIKTVIDRHLNVLYSNEELADFARTSVSTMIRHFKTEYGITPMDYQNKTKIKAIKEQLENSSLSLKEICNLTGFCAPSYLSSYFKKATGITPREYRNIKKTKHKKE